MSNNIGKNNNNSQPSLLDQQRPRPLIINNRKYIKNPLPTFKPRTLDFASTMATIHNINTQANLSTAAMNATVTATNTNIDNSSMPSYNFNYAATDYSSLLSSNNSNTTNPTTDYAQLYAQAIAAQQQQQQTINTGTNNPTNINTTEQKQWMYSNTNPYNYNTSSLSGSNTSSGYSAGYYTGMNPYLTQQTALAAYNPYLQYDPYSTSAYRNSLALAAANATNANLPTNNTNTSLSTLLSQQQSLANTYSPPMNLQQFRMNSSYNYGYNTNFNQYERRERSNYRRDRDQHQQHHQHQQQQRESTNVNIIQQPLSTAEKPTSIHLSSSSSPSSQQQRDSELTRDEDRAVQNYKTEICRSHYSTGHCDYGEACQFAHGVEELRAKQFDIKYKTELCKRYHALGPQHCKFSNRCKFIHDEYRIKAGDYEFWLVAPSENIIRVEIVDPRNKQRLQQLDALVFEPPQGPVTPLTPTPSPQPIDQTTNTTENANVISTDSTNITTPIAATIQQTKQFAVPEAYTVDQINKEAQSIDLDKEFNKLTLNQTTITTNIAESNPINTIIEERKEATIIGEIDKTIDIAANTNTTRYEAEHEMKQNQ